MPAQCRPNAGMFASLFPESFADMLASTFV